MAALHIPYVNFGGTHWTVPEPLFSRLGLLFLGWRILNGHGLTGQHGLTQGGQDPLGQEDILHEVRALLKRLGVGKLDPVKAAYDPLKSCHMCWRWNGKVEFHKIRVRDDFFQATKEDHFLTAAYGKRMSIHPCQPQWTQKAKQAMREKARSGTLPGCAPVGYRNAREFGEKHIEPDPKTAWQVRALFQFMADGLSLRRAGLHAFGLGLRSRNGKILGPSAIYAIVTNPFYMGMLRYKGELIQGKHEAIVSRKLFESAQKKSKRNTPYSTA